MRSFNEFVQNKTIEELAQFMVEHEVDIEKYCSHVKYIVEKYEIPEDQLVNELWGALSGMANVGRGIYGGATNLAGRGAQAVGNAGRAVGNAVGNAASAVGNRVQQGAQAVGNTVQQGAQAVGNAGRAVGNVAAKAGNAAWDATGGAIGDLYTQGKQGHQLQFAMDRVADLKKFLQGAGYENPNVDKALTYLVSALKQGQSNVMADRKLRFGQPGVFAKPRVPQSA
jgi:hypothetical protein